MIDQLLVEFFHEGADGWHKNRCDQEIMAAIEAGEENAAKRENEKERQRRFRQRRKALFEQLRGYGIVPKWDTTIDQLETELSQALERNGNAPVTPPVTRTDTAVPIANSQEPIASTSTTVAKATPPPCPHIEIIALYAKHLPACRQPDVTLWNGTRAQRLQARWREKPERQNLEWWDKFFGYIAESDFLTGRIAANSGRKPFQASLDWIVKSENFVKIHEGAYR